MKRLQHLIFERHRHNWVLFFKFALVGGSGVLVNLLVCIVMNKLNGGDANAQRVLFPLPGTDFNFRFTNMVWIVAFLVANTTNFQLNRSWTFQSSKHAGWWQEFLPFFTVGAVAAAVGFFIKLAMTMPTSPFFLPEPFFHGGEGQGLQSREYWAQLIAVVLTTPINFVVNKMWTFAAVRNRGSDVPLVAPVVAPEVLDERPEDEHSAYESADYRETAG